MLRALKRLFGRDPRQLEIGLGFAPAPRDAAAMLAALRAMGLRSIRVCRLTSNRNVMVSFGGGELRVHEGYLDAPPEENVIRVAKAMGIRPEDVTVTILRFANFIGGRVHSLFARYLSLPVVPTILGFDPRLQFCHPDDAVAVLERTVVEDHPGVFNVSGLGILYLSQAIRLAGRVPAPVPEPFMNLAGNLVRRSQRIEFSPEQLRFLLYGRVADGTRLREVLAFEPRYTTREAFDDYVARRRIRRLAETSEVEWDRELYDYLQRKGQERFATARRTGSSIEPEGEE
jgi:hypothetical protein